MEAFYSLRSPNGTIHPLLHFFSPNQLWLFRAFFRGCEDVFARYWYSTRTGKSGYAPAKFHDGSYVDFAVPMLKRMYFQRQRLYHSQQLTVKHERIGGGNTKNIPEDQLSIF